MKNKINKYFLRWLWIPFIAVTLHYSVYIIGLGGLVLQMLYCVPVSMFVKEPYFVFDQAVGWLPTYKALLLATLVYSLIYVLGILFFKLIRSGRP